MHLFSLRFIMALALMFPAISTKLLLADNTHRLAITVFRVQCKELAKRNPQLRFLILNDLMAQTLVNSDKAFSSAVQTSLTVTNEAEREAYRTQLSKSNANCLYLQYAGEPEDSMYPLLDIYRLLKVSTQAELVIALTLRGHENIRMPDAYAGTPQQAIWHQLRAIANEYNYDLIYTQAVERPNEKNVQNGSVVFILRLTRDSNLKKEDYLLAKGMNTAKNQRRLWGFSRFSPASFVPVSAIVTNNNNNNNNHHNNNNDDDHSNAEPGTKKRKNNSSSSVDNEENFDQPTVILDRESNSVKIKKRKKIADDAEAAGLTLQEQNQFFFQQQAAVPLEDPIYAVTHLEELDRTTLVGHLAYVVADGNCGFTALGLTRERFIQDFIFYWRLMLNTPVQQMSPADREIQQLIHGMMMRFNVITLDQLLQCLRSPGFWMDETLLEIVAYLYNMRIQLYYLPVEQVAGAVNHPRFMPLPGGEEVHIVPRRRAEQNPDSVVRLVWFAVGGADNPSGAFNHFDHFVPALGFAPPPPPPVFWLPPPAQALSRVVLAPQLAPFGDLDAAAVLRMLIFGQW